MRALAVVALAVLALLTAVAGRAADEVDDLRGRVVDAVRKQPVAGATVAVWLRSTPLLPPVPEPRIPTLDLEWPATAHATATTDASGNYAFRGVPRAAARWLTVAAQHHATAVADATTPSVPLDVALSPARLLRVRCVRGEPGDASPVAGVHVMVFPAGLSGPVGPRVRTDAEGLAFLAAADDATVVVRGPGIATEIRRIDTAAIEFAPERPLDLFVDEGVPLHGVVVRRDGAPVAGARVRHVPDDLDAGVRFATTDAAGRFEFDGVSPDGTARLGLVTPGLAAPEVFAVGGDSEIRLVADPCVRLRGRVLASDGSPAARATVRWCRPPREPSHRAVVEACFDGIAALADGTFEIPELGPGPWTLSAITADDRIAVRTIVVTPSPRPPAVELRVASLTVPCVVRVRDDAGHPVAGAKVSTVGVHGPDSAPRVTGADGVVDLRFAAPGALDGWPQELEIHPHDRTQRSLFVAVPRHDFDSGRVEVVLAGMSPVVLDISGPDGARVGSSGSAVEVLDGAKPVRVPLAAAPPNRDTILVPRRWPFRLTVVPALTERVQSEELLVHSHVHTAADANDGRLRVRFARGATLRAPLPHSERDDETIVVQATRDDAVGIAARRTAILGDVEGTGLTIRGVPDGRWTVVAYANDFGVGRLVVCRRVEVNGGSDLELGPAPQLVTVSGRVLARGKPLPGADVGISWSPALHDRSDAELRNSVDPDGRFDIECPAGADVLLFAEREGFGTVGRRIRPDRDLVADLALEPECVMIVRGALGAEGRPVRVRVTAGGVGHVIDPAWGVGEAVFRALAAGDVNVDVVVGEGDAERALRGPKLVAGATVEFDIPAE